MLPDSSSPGSTAFNMLSSSVAAHKIIPCDNSPLSFTGFKLATNTTFFPTKSSDL